MKTNLNYLALGDSYTIGEAVQSSESFPFQLVSKLNAQGLVFNNPQVIAKTGWTTDELAVAIEQENISKTFDLVTLLIGVNNQYRGLSAEAYRVEFMQLLKKAIYFANGDTEKVYVLSIPDWGLTEFANKQGKNAKLIAEEIDIFNQINREEAMLNHVAYVDITPISRTIKTHKGLIATDELHPSAKMYEMWASLLASAVMRLNHF